MTNNRSEDMDTSSFCDADGFGISKDGFTACVNQTIFTLIPFLFLIIVIPKRIRYLNTLRIYKALDNPIDILKTSLILIQMQTESPQLSSICTTTTTTTTIGIVVAIFLFIV